MNKLLQGLLFLAFATSSQVFAIELGESSQIHGFVNQAYLYSPDNPYAGTDANNGSLKFREIGINGFTEFSPDFRLAGQVLSRQQDQADDGDVRIDFLLADYLLFSDQSASLGVRAGRVKNNIGFYNAIRDIPSARPGYNVPDSIYFGAFRDTLLSIDGVNLYGSALFRDNLITWELSAGQRNIDSEDFEYFAFGQPLPRGEAEKVPLRILNVNLVPSFQRDLRLGMSLVDLEIELEDTLSVAEAQAALMSNPGDFIANPLNYVTGSEIEGLLAILSAQYSFESWIVTAEYLNLDSDLTAQFAGMDVSQSQTTEGYYLQLEWLASAQTSWFTRYEELYLNNDDRSGEGSATANNQYRGFGKGWTVGGKWQFKNDWSIVGQASFNEGTAWLPSYNGIEDEEIEKYWNYYVLSLNYQF
ncbi:hypothetical protein [Marinobacter sediminum]|uniref:hypothetical protein n=1 Tax=Marinobacter sediminum TaxID=256323 RepID=UPI001939F6D5|nr:hypothetical protein [Marinobacter sediminum]